MHTPHAPARPDPQRWRRQARLGLVALAVLGAHLWALDELLAIAMPQPASGRDDVGVAGQPGAPVAAAGARAVQVRTAQAAAAAAQAAPADLAPPSARPGSVTSAASATTASSTASGAARSPTTGAARSPAGGAGRPLAKAAAARPTPTPTPTATSASAGPPRAPAQSASSARMNVTPGAPTLTASDPAGGEHRAAAPRPPDQEPASRPAAGWVTPAAPLPSIVPANVELGYSVHRGSLAGKGRLLWRQGAGSYSLSLEARLPLIGTIFSESSSGGFDSHGLAPTRHTERRLRRSERALTITRDATGGGGVLSFSASSARLPLQPGTQDRVSWLAQLAAVYGAAAASLAPGNTPAADAPHWPVGLTMPVASVNGDLRSWQFRLLPATPADAGLLHLERRPAAGEYDTRAEVWLDPARQAWPVRVLLTEASGDVLELQLEP